MIWNRWVSAGPALVLLNTFCWAGENVPPSWSHQGEVKLQRAGLTEVTVPLGLLDPASPTLHDLRLFKPSGEEIPYSLNQPSRLSARWIKMDSFKSAFNNKTTALTGKAPTSTVDAIRLESPAGTFLKSVSLEVQEKGRWQTLWKGRPIYRTSPGSQNLEIEFPSRRLGRFRILVDDQNSEPIPFTGIAVRLTADSVPPIDKIPAVIAGREERPWDTHLTLALPSKNLYVDGVMIEVSDPLFQRSAQVVLQNVSREVNMDGGQQIIEIPLGRSTLHRSPGENGAVSENLFIPINRRIPAREIHLMVENGNAPPLEIKSVTIHHVPTRLLFFATDMHPFLLAAGHPGAPAPRYDWPVTRATPQPAPVENVRDNPLYVKPEVAPMLASFGAAFEDKGWGYRSAIDVKTSGVHSLEIPYSILVNGSLDGRDIRLVQNGNQIPFIFDRGTSPQPIVPDLLAVAKAPKGVSRWELKLPLKGIPIYILDVSAKEPLFQRSVHVYEERVSANGETYRHSFANTQWKRDENGGDRLLIFFAGFPQNDRIYFEIENGDNAPLSLENMKLYYRSYGIVFKAVPGAPLWLYYGQPEARFPVYDAALVADELLSAEKSKAVLGTPEKLKTRWVWGTPRNGETSALFWIVLAAVTLLLLFVIQRLLPELKEKP